MTKEFGRREKIIQLVKELTLVSTSEEYQVPATVSDFILQEYGLGAKTSSENVSDNELTELVSKIEDLIIEKSEIVKKKCDDSGGIATSGERNFMKACDAFVNAKNEYFQVCFELLSLVKEINQFRIRYCDHLKKKAAPKQKQLELLEKKIQILKKKSLYKLYSENNALSAHLKLMEVLKEKLKKLQLEYDNLVELNAKCSELKNNKAYCDLLSIYKQLLIRDMKLDYMLERDNSLHKND